MHNNTGDKRIITWKHDEINDEIMMGYNIMIMEHNAYYYW